MKYIRDLFLGNWRNKGVSLFFALAIWVVAFQSEKQELAAEIRIAFAPQDADKYIVTSVSAAPRADDSRRERVLGARPFDGLVRVEVSGPRKRIDELRQELALGRDPIELKVPPDTDFYRFEERDFNFARPGTGLTITIDSSWLVAHC